VHSVVPSALSSALWSGLDDVTIQDLMDLIDR